MNRHTAAILQKNYLLLYFEWQITSINLRMEIFHVKGFIQHINTKFNDALLKLLIKWNCIQEQLKANWSRGNMKRVLWIRVINNDKRWKSNPMHR